MKCEWCGQEMDSKGYIKTGMSQEHICKDCATEADNLGYDTNEL